MKHKPVTISPELAAKYEGVENQPERFHAVLDVMLKTPKDPATIKPEKRPRGRPKTTA